MDTPAVQTIFVVRIYDKLEPEHPANAVPAIAATAARAGLCAEDTAHLAVAMFALQAEAWLQDRLASTKANFVNERVAHEGLAHSLRQVIEDFWKPVGVPADETATTNEEAA